MKTFVQNGEKLTVASASCVAAHTPPSSGDPVVCGRLTGVAARDGVSSGNTTFSVKGVYTVPVTATAPISLGETVYIDPTTGVVSSDLTDVPFGHAMEALASGTSNIKVRLLGPTAGAIGANS